MTHYIPAYPDGRRRRAGRYEQTAVCGFWTRVEEHSNEPSCPRCQAWLGKKPPAPEPMARSEYRCTSCHQEKKGRFTIPAIFGGGGWDQGFQHLLWYCWDCLPHGKGRYDEHRDAPKEMSHAH